MPPRSLLDLHRQVRTKLPASTQMESWGFNREERAENYKTIPQLVEMLVSNVAYGGNLLLNVGPTSDGRIIPIMEERLIGMGEWLEVNGEAIYSTKVWRNQSEVSLGHMFTILDNMSNIDYAGIPKPAGSTATVKYLGKVHSVGDCLAACESESFEKEFSKACLSFTWHSNDCPQPEWSSVLWGDRLKMESHCGTRAHNRTTRCQFGLLHSQQDSR